MGDSAQKSAGKAQAPAAERRPQRRLAPAPGVEPGVGAVHALQRTSGNHAVHAMLGGGSPLSPRLRAEFEARFGADFSGVRIHDGRAADATARALRANAYTVGDDIVFGAQRFAPFTSAGKRLLAHELAHVIQQRRGGAAPALAEGAAHERGADSAARAYASGAGPIGVQGATAVGVARDKSDAGAGGDSLGALPDAAIDSMASFMAGGEGLQQRMIAAAMRGFAAEMVNQLVAQGKGERAVERLSELVQPAVYAEVSLSYAAGLLAGFVSPVTDLFGIPAFLDAAGDFMTDLEMRIGRNAVELLDEGSALRTKFRALKKEAAKALRDILKELAKDPNQIYTLIDKAGDKAVQMAGSAGHGAAREVIGAFEAPWEEEKDEDPGWGSVLPKNMVKAVVNPAWEATATLSRAWEYGTERAKKKIFSTPWSKVGYAIGHALGALVANILLLIFTEGIGDAIAAIGKGLGEIAPALRAAGSVVGKIGEALELVGRAVKEVEEAIAAVMKTVLKPLEKVLKPFEDLLMELRAWLRKILGVAEKEAPEALAGATAKATQHVPDKAPKTPLKAPPRVEPHVSTGTASADDAAANAAKKLESQSHGPHDLGTRGEERVHPTNRKDTTLPDKAAQNPKAHADPAARGEPKPAGHTGEEHHPVKDKTRKQKARPKREALDDDADAARERQHKRQRDKSKKQQRKHERASAGKDEQQIAHERAEKELRRLEDRARQPGASSRSPKKKEKSLKRFEDVSKDAQGPTIRKSQRKGKFDEQQRTPRNVPAQRKYVAGGQQLPDQDLPPGRSSYAQPEHQNVRRTPEGRVEQRHVNLKSDMIDRQTPSQARATAKRYTDQAVNNMRHLPGEEGIIIDYAHTPSKEVQEAMLREHFREGSPITEVRFGTTTHRRSEWKPPVSAPPAAKPAKSPPKKKRSSPRRRKK